MYIQQIQNIQINIYYLTLLKSKQIKQYNGQVNQNVDQLLNFFSYSMIFNNIINYGIILIIEYNFYWYFSVI
jgi:uncharacterized membrane protein